MHLYGAVIVQCVYFPLTSKTIHHCLGFNEFEKYSSDELPAGFSACGSSWYDGDSSFFQKTLPHAERPAQQMTDMKRELSALLLRSA